MVISGRNGEQLVKEAPFTLLALTRHAIEPHEEQWFSRCRADYLRSFPLSLLELVRLLVLLSLVGPMQDLKYTFAAVLGWSLVIGTQMSVRRMERKPGFDQSRALYYRAGTIRLRAIWWCTLLCWGLMVVPQANLTALTALGIALMVVDGISVLALPHLALAASSGGAFALVLASSVRSGVESTAPLAVTVLVLAAFLHWSIYNLYYMFATRRIRTRRLSQSNETVQLLLNQYDDEGSDWLYEIDENSCIHNATTRFAKASGQTVDELEGMALADLFDPGESLQTLLDKMDAKQPFRNMAVPVTILGEQHWWSVSGRPADGGGWRGFIADISANKRSEARIAFMAHYDLLTQLPNRTLFNATMARAFSRKTGDEVLGLLYIDLDHFKAINDGYGHATGDMVLAEVARRLETALRPRDMLARLGGDEFVILLPDLNSIEGAIIAAERVLEIINVPVEINGQLMPIGASIGIAYAPHNASNGDELLRAADLAMYDAKQRGRRGISVFDPEMQVQMQERRQLELDLRAAIIRGELELHYQPLVNIQSGETTGYEALLRWNHATRGMVSPVVFIPIAEETGVIVEIGEWVLRTALSEAAKWPDQLTVAVNLSPAQMHDANLLAVVMNALAHNGIVPDRLELEITESLMMQDSPEVLSLLHKLRSIGVRIALDDFGTGYSSLNYLRSFPFDKIKIDRCFINELANREDCQAIVRSVIALANDLNMTTTAEGVELNEQLEKLKMDGCDQVQGFYFSRALPASELHYGEIKGLPAPAEREAARLSAASRLQKSLNPAQKRRAAG